MCVNRQQVAWATLTTTTDNKHNSNATQIKTVCAPFRTSFLLLQFYLEKIRKDDQEWLGHHFQTDLLLLCRMRIPRPLPRRRCLLSTRVCTHQSEHQDWRRISWLPRRHGPRLWFAPGYVTNTEQHYHFNVAYYIWYTSLSLAPSSSPPIVDDDADGDRNCCQCTLLLASINHLKDKRFPLTQQLPLFSSSFLLL